MDATKPAVKLFDPGADCRGKPCDNAVRCLVADKCEYRSSAAEAAERLSPALELPPQPLKPSNPKDLIGSDKIPLHLWPETATALGALGLLDGALKYGRSNFRAIGVRSTIYMDAARRHLGFWFEGEDIDPDSGLPHLAHALACLAIVVDAEAAGKLNDDRNVAGGFRKWMNGLTPHVKRLKQLHASKSPKHYTIADEVTE